MLRIRPLTFGAQLLFSTPVRMLNDSRLLRGVRLVPAAAPAGRALANWPPA